MSALALNLIVAVAAVVGTRAPSSEASDEAVRAWLLKETQLGASVSGLGSMAFAWRYETFCILTPAELEQLRAEVRGHPQHPRRGELQEAERQLRDGFTMTKLRLVSDGGERWRFGLDFPGMLETDTVVTPRRPWRLANGTLTLFDAAIVREGRDPQQQPQSDQSVFVPDLDALFHGSLGRVGISRMSLVRLAFERDRWVAVFASNQADLMPLEYSYSVRWDDSASRGFVTEWAITRNDVRPASVGSRQTFDEWTYDDTLSRWVAKRVNCFDAQGRRWRSLVNEGAIGLTGEALQKVFEPPKPLAADALRGSLRLTRRIDLAEHLEETIDPESGQVVNQTQLPFSPSVSRARRTDQIGWITLGALTLIVGLAIALGRWRLKATH